MVKQNRNGKNEIPFYPSPYRRGSGRHRDRRLQRVSTTALTPIAGPSSPPSGTVYKQIELLSRPAVKEAFEAFEDHNKTNRSEPYADPVLKKQIKTFSLMFRGKKWADTLQAILYPNVMKADLSQNTTKAAYLGYETGGATGSKFGGRGLDDDVIDISLGRDLRQYALGARADSRRQKRSAVLGDRQRRLR